MFRIVLVVLALAVYGAYSLVGSLTESKGSQGSAEAMQPLSSGFSVGSATDMAIAAASKTAGVQFAPLPKEGCSDSMLPPTKVADLVTSLPEPQRTALATVLNASSNVWTAQLYKGEKGVGLCLPIQEKLIVLPTGVNTAVDQLGAAVAPLQDSLSSTKDNE